MSGSGKFAPFRTRIADAPYAARDHLADLADYRSELAETPNAARMLALLADDKVARLIAGTLAGSPYLRHQIRRDPVRLARCLDTAPEDLAATCAAQLSAGLDAAGSFNEAMRALRTYKAEIALLTALADLAGIWPVMTVTAALSNAADHALTSTIRFLLREAARRGDFHPADPACPERASGYIVLGVGKYGALELNYSSDIDLIVFYDALPARLRPGLEPSTFFVRLTRDLVRLIDERTADGYVFRTDLRLRPDAGATQIALSTDAAAGYYESFGQNWERAALIKARPVAGDIEAGEVFLASIAPFIWRRNLDFAAIADIHAMKRQINAFRGFGEMRVAGQNVKLGPGGIREIEFFVQTQQLIAGGRQRHLRSRQTLEALEALAATGWIERAAAADLTEAYLYLRRIEHRIQMVADEQTHELPESDEDLERFARFAGYETLAAFSAEFLAVLRRVGAHYGRLFEGMPQLTASGESLVFAGEVDDPATLATLTGLGYERPSDVLALVRGWHHGRYPAIRSPRARELLTEVQPQLVKALARTAEPDRAMASFDRFLAELPAGVQLFSLLKANPALLRLMADIMGTAPRLAQSLSRRRRLLDAVIDPATFAADPTAEDVKALIENELATAASYEARLDRARIIGSEQAFLIGIKVLSGAIGASRAGPSYALLAERLIAALARAAAADMERAHGRVQGGEAAIVAMGKLGGREMTAASDLDLIVIYDFDPRSLQSDGDRPLSPMQYYTRFTQRLINALAAPTAEGRLYDVDMRLRPSGQKGPVAVQLSTFADYQAHEAWTWEHMALTRARLVTGPPDLRAKIETAIQRTLTTPRDRSKIAADVREMRARIAAEKGTDKLWDLKQVRGGLVDLEFIAQHLQLVHAAAHPEVLDQSTHRAFEKLARFGLLDAGTAATLISTTRLIEDLTQVLRLCLDEAFTPEAAPAGLKDLLARAGNAPSFQTLETDLRQRLSVTARLFEQLIV